MIYLQVPHILERRLEYQYPIRFIYSEIYRYQILGRKIKTILQRIFISRRIEPHTPSENKNFLHHVENVCGKCVLKTKPAM